MPVIYTLINAGLSLGTSLGTRLHGYNRQEILKHWLIRSPWAPSLRKCHQIPLTTSLWSKGENTSLPKPGLNSKYESLEHSSLTNHLNSSYRAYQAYARELSHEKGALNTN